MSQIKVNIIAAACENMGIGIKGKLPWRLKNELKYFQDVTLTTSDKNKINAVIMGRKTYLGIPESKRPLQGRLNIILSRNWDPDMSKNTNVLYCNSLKCAFDCLRTPEYEHKIENIWIIGGSSVYKEVMESGICHRIFLTEIQGQFECDTFFPSIPKNFKRQENYKGIPCETQIENGIKYTYQVYENVQS